MAPRRPLSAKSSSRAADVSASAARGAGSTGSVAPRTPSASYRAPKVVKRAQRHAAFVSRIAKTHKKPTSKVAKRRRPSTTTDKFATSLAGLVDALPTTDTERTTQNNRTPDAIEFHGLGPVRIRNATLKSRAGAQKKRAALESHEREWFAKNLANLSTMAGQADAKSTSTEGTKSAPTTNPNSNPWDALKSHIAGNLQKTRTSGS